MAFCGSGTRRVIWRALNRGGLPTLCSAAVTAAVVALRQRSPGSVGACVQVVRCRTALRSLEYVNSGRVFPVDTIGGGRNEPCRRFGACCKWCRAWSSSMVGCPRGSSLLKEEPQLPACPRSFRLLGHPTQRHGVGTYAALGGI